jgi:hypothetical protein
LVRRSRHRRAGGHEAVHDASLKPAITDDTAGRRGRARTYPFLFAALATSLCVMFGTMGLWAEGAHAYPLRTHVPWAVLLCQFSDSPAPAQTPAYYADMFINRGTGGVADYFHDVSYGNIDFAGSVVRGWYRQSQTQAQEVARGRGDRFNDCVNAARTASSGAYSVAAGYRTVVITSPSIDEWGGGGAAFLGEGIDVTGAAHEMGHGMGMIHSFSDDPNYRNVSWAQIGEYDDEWDLMSAANVYTTPTPRFGSAPPGLNGFGLDRAGWLPRGRVFNFGQNGEASDVVTLAALNHPEVGGTLLVRVPFDPGDLLHYYTVELRTADGWDGGIPGAGVMIHEVKLNTNGNVYQSFLIRNHTGSRDPVTSLSANGVNISVNSVSAGTHQASVSITGNIADRCLQGYVWREARADDHVCVTPATRSQTWADNAAAASRRNPAGGPFGPDTCLPGYVWREAFLGDHVCVTPATRSQAAADNAQAAGRRNPSRFVYGATTCAPGYVWREADANDYVCVTPGTRSQTWADNAAAASRRNPAGGPFGPDTCLPGYVWREAFLGDHVCVTPATRSQASADNTAAEAHVAHA